MYRKKVLPFLLVLMFLLTGCSSSNEIQLGTVDNEESDIVVGVISEPSAYTIDGSEGLYANHFIGNRKVTFLGLRDYNPSAKQQESIPEGYKALVTAFSVETLMTGKSASITASGVKLVNTVNSSLYGVQWNIDKDVEMDDEKIAGTVVCIRLIFLVPDDVQIDDCIVLFQHSMLPDTLRFAMQAPQAEIAGTAIDYVNMCPLCNAAEYEYDRLNVVACEMCSRKFTSGHSPSQRICFSCSVIYNYCTQCTRYIEKNNTTIIKK